MTSHPSDWPVSALRARMIADMSVRGFSEKTRNDYIRNVRAFAGFIGRSPDTATAEDLRRFQHHQAQTGVRPPSINSAVAALRFLFTVTLDRPDLSRRLTIVREPRRRPAVLSVEEVTLLLQAAPGPKYNAAFATAYGAGLRVSEVVALKVGDIDFGRRPSARADRSRRAGIRNPSPRSHSWPRRCRPVARGCCYQKASLSSWPGLSRPSRLGPTPRRVPWTPGTRQSQAGGSRIEAVINLIGSGATGRRLPWIALVPQADAPGGRCGCGAPPAGSCPWCPSTGRGSLARSARDARFPWRRHTGAPARRPATPGSASGSCARSRASRCTRNRRGRGTCWSG